MSVSPTLIKDESISKTVDALVDMRLIVEGAALLYEEDASSLHRLGKANDQYAAGLAFDTLGTALYSLRAYVRDLQNALAETLKHDEPGPIDA